MAIGFSVIGCWVRCRFKAVGLIVAGFRLECHWL